MAGKKSDKAKRGKVLPPKEEEPSGKEHVTQAVIALFSERPDLMIDALENRDKGFVKRMNKTLEEREERLHLSRFHFTERQAYFTLFMRGVSGLFALYLLYLAVAVVSKFWIIIPAIIFYAISQSGSEGFSELAKALGQWIRQISKSNGKGD